MSENDNSPASPVPHRRRNLLTGDWVLVSPHRMTRPWQGEAAPAAAPPGASHDPSCYLCPGNRRANGEDNPPYSGTFTFPNDFAALLPQSVEPPQGQGLFASHPARGEARVICYAPDHSATMARLSPPAMAEVIAAWCDLSRDLGMRWDHVQIFENKGAMMGASSPHPHGQVWASDFVPDLPEAEDLHQRDWRAQNGTVLLDAVVAAEEQAGTRIIEANDHWIAFVPFWAAWPFETLLVARGPAARLEDLDQDARTALGTILARLLSRYDGLFGCDFPYSMGWHGAPHGLGSDTAHWRLHAHFFPPLLRSATVRKHMVGFELMAETQRDLTPEAAAERLRGVVPA
ncbi:UDP-glucose--hexose-1-phosphate uridylyltransferase [Novosphingobium sp.]|uniref:UDP-glucose--hexose-1-phosphate uridylyltransferase n=1 Tax=Novosphingobium sp. TaxID=1874826 RepID=UPI0025F925E0|nr:UDP-glucose--hexose-1-phosphate uridylyltransferase [Novosphingobium sp.]